jgi:hypothetical protein
MAEPALNLSSNQSSSSGQLSDLEARILEFEKQWWQYAGAKESSIRDLFQLSPSRYYEILNHLIDRDEALVAAPMLVKRLRRMREARLAERHGR